jgi:hypothetical protein
MTLEREALVAATALVVVVGWYALQWLGLI